MRADAALVSALVAVSIILLAAYLAAARRERSAGRDPHLAREVYSLADADAGAALRDPGARATLALAAPATPGQVRVYFASGGADPDSSVIWLYGPKPHRGTPGVSAFSRAAWFQPGHR